MKKEDLRNGMRVKIRSHHFRDDYFIVFDDVIVHRKWSGKIKTYNDYLENRDDESLNIVSVYNKPASIEDLFNFEVAGGLLWEREEHGFKRAIFRDNDDDIGEEGYLVAILPDYFVYKYVMVDGEGRDAVCANYKMMEYV